MWKDVGEVGDIGDVGPEIGDNGRGGSEGEVDIFTLYLFVQGGSLFCLRQMQLAAVRFFDGEKI